MSYRYFSVLRFTIVVLLIGNLGFTQQLDNLALFDSLCVDINLYEFSATREPDNMRRIYFDDELKKAGISATFTIDGQTNFPGTTRCEKTGTTAYVKVYWNYGYYGILGVYADYQGLQDVVIYAIGPFIYESSDEIFLDYMEQDMDRAITSFIEDWLASRHPTLTENEK